MKDMGYNALTGILSEQDNYNKPKWPDPTQEQLKSKAFNTIWNVIKTWDINVPEQYCGYCGASGNHVVAILNALNKENLILNRAEKLKRILK